MHQLNNVLDIPGHKTVIGTTGGGKTYTVLRLLKNVNVGVFFFNTKRDSDDMPTNYIYADADNLPRQIKTALKDDKKINYVPSREIDKRDRELVLLIEYLFNAGFTTNNYFYFVVDEVHLFGKEVQKSLIELATTGRSFGFRGVYLSQRPALIDNTLMSLSEQMVIFKCNMEGPYFDRYRIPYSDVIEPQLNSLGDYSYCLFSSKGISCFPAIRG